MGLFTKKKKEMHKEFLLHNYIKSFYMIQEGRKILYKRKLTENQHDALVEFLNSNIDINKSCVLLLANIYKIEVEDDGEYDNQYANKARKYICTKVMKDFK